MDLGLCPPRKQRCTDNPQLALRYWRSGIPTQLNRCRLGGCSVHLLALHCPWLSLPPRTALTVSKRPSTLGFPVAPGLWFEGKWQWQMAGTRLLIGRSSGGRRRCLGRHVLCHLVVTVFRLWVAFQEPVGCLVKGSGPNRCAGEHRPENRLFRGYPSRICFNLVFAVCVSEVRCGITGLPGGG